MTKAQWFSTDPKIRLSFSFKPCSLQNTIYKSIDAFIHTLTHGHMHISESKGYVLQTLSEFKGIQIYRYLRGKVGGPCGPPALIPDELQ